MTEYEDPKFAGTAVAAQPGPEAPATTDRVAELERELARLRGREAGWRQERRRLLAALEAAERELVDLPALEHELRAARDTGYWLEVVQSSLSWRITRPLRAAARLRSLLGPRSRA
jgi:DNA-binding IclR family transcriptional regulator